jgi:hypothetical protein
MPDPVTNEKWLTDPTYYWYYQCMLELIAAMDARTYNCTEGGILYGDHVEVAPFNEFLTQAVRNQTSAGTEEV